MDLRSPPRRALLRVVLFAAAMLVVASAADAAMETLRFRYGSSGFSRPCLPPQWWDPSLSWHNKWKDGAPSHGEAFPFSSTALVWTTDAWHFFKSLGLLAASLALLAPFTLLIRLPPFGWIALCFAIQLIYGAVFEFLFGHLLLR